MLTHSYRRDIAEVLFEVEKEKRGKAMAIEKKERTVIDRPIRIRQPSEMLSDRDLGGAFLTCG